MSKEQAVAFGKKVNEDPVLREEVRALGRNVGGIVDLGAREGFTFTRDELMTAVKDNVTKEGEELSEADLENVAGGTIYLTATGC